MNNAEKFEKCFGIYATELWAMPEKDFLKWLNDEAEEKQWIPCEERLPEQEEKAYLVYLDNGHICDCKWWCLDHVFLKPTDNWRWDIFDIPQYSRVLAWMPLPKPYEGERKEDEID